MWQKHYGDLFNSAKSSISAVDEINNKEDVIVSSREIYDAIRTLKDGKARGMDKISAEYLKPLLAICFTGFTVCVILPDSIFAVMLEPIIRWEKYK